MSGGPEAAFSGDDVFVSRFPVHRACRDGDVGALVLLLQQLSNRIHLTAEDSFYGWTPIHWAAHYGQLECVAHLVQMGCEVNRLTSRFNQTPTHTAAFGGHPHCVVWLTQAGADVNKQDLVGEAPIHKAARSGSLECIQVLLIAGAKPHLKNASGQTAADLAHAHGFHDCFCIISNAQRHLHQRGGLGVSIVPNGNGAPCGQGPLSRKRQLAAVDSGHMKKARGADGVLVQVQSCVHEQLEGMNLEISSDLANGHHHASPPAAYDEPLLPKSALSPASQTPAPPQRALAEMCGSLHLSSSPCSCASDWPACPGPTGADRGDFLYYGHYHGFGDTAEELSESSCIQAEHRSAGCG
ncbi:ankyrin repeat domain-containing protein 10-like [Archocentrus centrarchus]|uniref:ankyrin repeat domain-containing protein 10-like n=1 Tax=Archocentrus centrarchus TaxID=63155 RepID=UPI0011E9ED92|nr:ankyrin repeat domain-containing protein 10-like [Archocentrus centrarchus]